MKKHLTLKNDLNEIIKIRSFIDSLFNNGLIDEGNNIKLNLVVEEMFTNIVNYGFKDSLSHDIDVIIDFDNGYFTATLIDDGIDFDPLKHQVQDLDAPIEERRIGGLGIHLMKNIMDEYFYKRENDKNILIIKKFTKGE